jgi:ABC-type multidrug transport system fused ATPase/permease subunit
MVITAIGVSEKLFSLMDEKCEIVGGPVKQEKPLRGDLTFKDAIFEYPTKKGVQVLKNINFSI